MKEEFKPVYYKGKELLYLVSNKGRVYSKKYGRYLNPGYSSAYQKVSLTVSPNKRREFYVHRLVAEAFIPNPNNYKVVNHKDFNRSNNKVTNLEWIDHRGNYLHTLRNGAFDDAIYPRIKRKDVEIIGQMLESGYTYKQIVNRLSQYTPGNIHLLIHRPSKRDMKILSKYNIRKKGHVLHQVNSRKRESISEEDLLKVIKMMEEGKQTRQISKELGIKESTLSGIRSGANWKDFTEGRNLNKQKRIRLTEELVKPIIEYLKVGYSVKEINKLTGISIKNIQHIKEKRRFTNLTKDIDFPIERREIRYEGKLPLKTLKSVIRKILNRQSIRSIISRHISITKEDIIDIIKHRKYNEVTKGIIFCGINNSINNNNQKNLLTRKNSSNKLIIKFKDYNSKRRCHRAFERLNKTNQIKKKISNKQVSSKLIIKFKNSKYKQKCYKQFNGSESRYDINMKLLNKDPKKKALLDNIISLIMKGKTNKDIAKKLNINRDYVNHIRTKDKYGWYTEGLEFPDIYKSPHTDQMFKDVADLIMMKYRDNQIMELLPQYNLTRSTICAIRQHRMGRELLKDYDFPVLPRDKKIDKNKLKIKFRINGKVL